MAINFKAKGNPLVSVLACNVLATAFQDEENWPDSFVKVRKDCSFHPFKFIHYSSLIRIDPCDLSDQIDHYIAILFYITIPISYLIDIDSYVVLTDSCAVSDPCDPSVLY